MSKITIGMNLSPHWISPAFVPQFAAAGTDAHRIFTGAEGWAERLGNDVLISYKTDAARDEILGGLDEWCSEAGLMADRVFARFLAKQNADRVSPVLVRGDAERSIETVVTENHLRYGIDFSAGYSAGLFIDQRANRLFLQKRSADRVLNTFSYTCSFSVVAAQAGAKTVSIDLSGKSLTRGKANFALNGLDVAGHKFIADDVLEVLPRMIRKKELFDAIILDPPTFSRGARGKRFQAEENLTDLLRLGLQFAAPGAAILLSTNCTRIDTSLLQRIARSELRVAARQGKLHYTEALPDFPAGAGARTVWLLLV
ncbi:MAG TPA: class I SAM-dependent methyltransferase [Chthoniobacterales bacterium]